ncbi:MAG: glycosyltransferase involved in cell wall biosynthesis [Hyphomicrobiaceae bacterium]|jgi:glycosyltransferase involved in cell wall biosynthesis
MKWALIGPGPEAEGGVAAHQRRLGQSLVSAGHCVEQFGFVRLYPGWTGARPNLGPTGQLDTLHPATWTAVARQLEASKPDVVIFQYWHPLCVPAYLRLLRSTRSKSGAARIVLVVHNAVPHEPFPGARALLAKLVARADHVITHSTAVTQRLPACRRVSLLELPALIRLDQSRKPLEATPTQVEFFLAPGPKRAYKGAGLLGRAWRQARFDRRVELVVAGSQRIGGGRWRWRATSVPDIVFWNRYFDDDELVWMLSHCAALVLPYRWATQSGWPAAARLLGVPVIATDVGGLAEQLKGADADLVAAGDCVGLAAAMVARARSRSRSRSRSASASASLRPDRAIDLAVCERTATAKWKELGEAIEHLVDQPRPSAHGGTTERRESVFPGVGRGMLRSFR